MNSKNEVLVLKGSRGGVTQLTEIRFSHAPFNAEDSKSDWSFFALKTVLRHMSLCLSREVKHRKCNVMRVLYIRKIHERMRAEGEIKHYGAH